jgi:hypothetical protein
MCGGSHTLQNLGSHLSGDVQRPTLGAMSEIWLQSASSNQFGGTLDGQYCRQLLQQAENQRKRDTSRFC